MLAALFVFHSPDPCNGPRAKHPRLREGRPLQQFECTVAVAANVQISYMSWLVYALFLNFGVYLLNGAPVKI